MRRKLLLFAIFLSALLCSSLVVSVDATSMWSQTYGDTGFQGANSLVVTSDGGYAFAGSTSLGSYASESDHFWLVKTDANGNMQWNKTYGLGTAHSVIATSDGGFAFAGTNGTFWSMEFCLMKTDEFGNLQWKKTHGERGFAQSLIATSDGGYAIAGGTFSVNAGEILRDAVLVKTDAFGNLQWNQTYGGTDDSLRSLIATSDGGYAIAGSKGGNSWLVKTDALGNMQWNKTYEETVQGGARALVLSPDGGYTIAGWHSGSEYDYWLVKTDALGNIQWHKTYGGAQFYPELIMAPDGGYVMAGIRFLVKTDPLGNMEWNQTYEEAGIIYSVNSVVAMSDGGYTLGGSMHIIEPLCRKAWLVKTDEFGVVPEYSSWIVHALVLTATAFIIINKKKLLRRHLIF